MRIHNESLYCMVSSIFREVKWLPWRFSDVSREFWIDMKNQRNFLDWVATQLNYKEKEDWYKITNEVLKNSKNF